MASLADPVTPPQHAGGPVIGADPPHPTVLCCPAASGLRSMPPSSAWNVAAGKSSNRSVYESTIRSGRARKSLAFPFVNTWTCAIFDRFSPAYPRLGISLRIRARNAPLRGGGRDRESLSNAWPSSSLLEEREHILSRGIRRRQDRGTGLGENLRPREFGSLVREVGIADLRFGRRDVLQTDLKTSHISLERIPLERTETSPKHRDFGDGTLQNITRRTEVTRAQRVILAPDDAVEEVPNTLDGRTTDSSRGDRLHPDTNALRRGDIGAELELGAPTR